MVGRGIIFPEDGHIALREAQLYYCMVLRWTVVVPRTRLSSRFSAGVSSLSAPRTLQTHEVVAKRGGEGTIAFGEIDQVQGPAVSVDVMNTLEVGDGFGAACV